MEEIERNLVLNGYFLGLIIFKDSCLIFRNSYYIVFVVDSLIIYSTPCSILEHHMHHRRGLNFSFSFHSLPVIICPYNMFLNNAMQELKRREDAVLRGSFIFLKVCAWNNKAGWFALSCDIQYESILLFGSWSRYRGEKLATILSNHSSWYCKWNNNPFAEVAVCCIQNIVWYVNLNSYLLI